MSFAVDNGQAKTAPGRPMSLPRLREMKASSETIVAVSTPHHALAETVEAASVDVVLLDARAGNHVLGHGTTAFVTMQEMLALAAAVRRAVYTGLFVVELPFGSWEATNTQAVATAIKFVKDSGCDAVKVAAAGVSPERADAIVGAGLPVLGHVGFEPQSASALRRGDAQVHTAHEAVGMLRRALALQTAGCFALVLDALPLCVVEALMPRLRIPAIGIKSGAITDGQVIMQHDFNASHGLVTAAPPAVPATLKDTVDAVRDRTFPATQYSYDLTQPERNSFDQILSEPGWFGT